MLRRLTFLIFCFAVFLILSWFCYRTALDKGSRKFIGSVADYAKRYGMEFYDPLLEHISIRSLDTLTARNFTTRIRLNQNKENENFQSFTLNIDEINLRAESLSEGRFVFYLQGLNLVAEDPLVRDEQGLKNLDRMVLEHLFMEFQLDLFNPREIKSNLKSISREIVLLFHEGVSSIPVRLEGKSIIHFTDGVVEVRLKIEDDKNQYRLTVPSEDVKKASKILDLDMTPAEIELFRKYPLRMPKLVKVRRRAIAEAKRAHAENYSIPTDAYRHILWSYWLTKLYGPSFAEEVTRAHEQGAKNTPEEIALDSQHNAAGRDYAVEGVLEHNLIDHMMQDEAIVLSINTPTTVEGMY